MTSIKSKGPFLISTSALILERFSRSLTKRSRDELLASALLKVSFIFCEIDPAYPSRDTFKRF